MHICNIIRVEYLTQCAKSNNIVIQALHWTLEGYRSGRQSKNIWKKSSVYSRFQVQLEEDVGGSTRQTWMETIGLGTGSDKT